MFFFNDTYHPIETERKNLFDTVNINYERTSKGEKKTHREDLRYSVTVRFFSSSLSTLFAIYVNVEVRDRGGKTARQ